jgi:hypothetical protein
MPKHVAPQSSKLPYTNKVWHTLKCLDHETHLRLLRFLRSPYFIVSKTMPTLCEALLKYVERGDPGFDRELVWQKTFPGETYDDVNFRKCCSDLLRLITEFMTQEMIAQDPARQAIFALTYAVENKVEPVIPGALRLAKSLTGEKTYRTLNDLWNTYAYEYQYYATIKDKVYSRTNLDEISAQLDLVYLIEKLKLYGAMLSQQRIGSHTYDLTFMEPILAFLHKRPMENTPELEIYYLALLTLHEEENISHYFNLRRLLDEYATKMPQKEAIELYDAVLHYCTGRINKGDRSFFQEYFNVFAEAIQKGVFLQNGELATWRYTNVVAAALGLGKVDWAENFVQSYKDALPSEARQNTYTLNLARIYRFQKKHDEVLELLQNVEYEDIGINLISKVTLLITHYERKDYEVLNSFIDSFRVFLNRHKNIPQQRRAGYLNLLKYTRRLIRLRPGDKAAVTRLKEEVSREKNNIVNYTWLVEKLEEL